MVEIIVLISKMTINFVANVETIIVEKTHSHRTVIDIPRQQNWTIYKQKNID